MDSRGIPIVATQKHPTTPRRAPIYSGNHTPRRNNDIPSSPYINLRNEHSLLEAYDSFTDACFQSQFNHSLVSECFNFRDLFRADLFPSFNEIPPYHSSRKRSFTVETEEDEDPLPILENTKKFRLPSLSSPSRSMTPMEDDDDEDDELQSFTQHMMPSLSSERSAVQVPKLQSESNSRVEVPENNQNSSSYQDTVENDLQTHEADCTELSEQDMMEIDVQDHVQEPVAITMEAEQVEKSLSIDPVKPSDDTQNKQQQSSSINQSNLVQPSPVVHNTKLTEDHSTVDEDIQEQSIPTQEAPITPDHTILETALPETQTPISQQQTPSEQSQNNPIVEPKIAEAETEKQAVGVRTRGQRKRRGVVEQQPVVAQPKRITRSRAKLTKQTDGANDLNCAMAQSPTPKPSPASETKELETPVANESTPMDQKVVLEELVTNESVPVKTTVDLPVLDKSILETPLAEPTPNVPEVPAPEPTVSIRRSTRLRKPTAVALEQQAQQVKPRATRKRGKKQNEAMDTAQKKIDDKALLPTPFTSPVSLSAPSTLPQPFAADSPLLPQATQPITEEKESKTQSDSVEETKKQTESKKETSLLRDKYKGSEDELQRRARRKAESNAEIKQILDGFPSLSRYYKLLHRAGSGTFSRVYKAKDLLADQYMPYEQKEKLAQALGKTATDMTHVAIKVIMDISTPARVANEIDCLLKLRSSPGITPLITAFRNEAITYVVLPYIEFDPFEDFYATMSLSDARSYISELLIGLQSAHEKGIAHRDVKPGNFLYSKSTRLGYLADFGLARKTCPPSPSKRDINKPFGSSYPGEQAGYYVDDTRPSLHADRSGTRGFRAPELLMRYKHQTTAVDIWAVGVILLIILSGQYPFFEPDDDADGILELAHVFGMKKLREFTEFYGRNIHTNINTIPEDEVDLGAVCHEINKERIDTWNSNDYQLAVDLMKKCLQLIHTDRLTATEALNHPFIKAVK